MPPSDSLDNPYAASPATVTERSVPVRGFEVWRALFLILMAVAAVASGIVVLMAVYEVVRLITDTTGFNRWISPWGYVQAGAGAFLLMSASVVSLYRILKRRPRGIFLAVLVTAALVIYIGGAQL